MVNELLTARGLAYPRSGYRDNDDGNGIKLTRVLDGKW